MALQDGLIHLWELEENSGTRRDSLGSLDCDAITGTPTAVNAISRKGMSCDGSEYAQNTVGPLDWLGAEEFSFGGWAYFNTLTGDQTLLEVAVDDASVMLIYKQASNIITAFVRQDDLTFRITNTVATVSAEVWVHLMVTFKNGDAMRLYVDAGTPITDTADDTFITSTSTPRISLGSNSGSLPLDGIADQVGVWNRQLTAMEISELYNSGTGIQLIGLVPNHAYQKRRTPGHNVSYF